MTNFQAMTYEINLGLIKETVVKHIVDGLVECMKK